MSKNVNDEIVRKIREFINGNINEFLKCIKHLPEKERAQTMLKLLQIVSDNKESSVITPPIYNINFISTGVRPINSEAELIEKQIGDF